MLDVLQLHHSCSILLMQSLFKSRRLRAHCSAHNPAVVRVLSHPRLVKAWPSNKVVPSCYTVLCRWHVVQRNQIQLRTCKFRSALVHLQSMIIAALRWCMRTMLSMRKPR
jgi:hypothetical protein